MPKSSTTKRVCQAALSSAPNVLKNVPSSADSAFQAVFLGMKIYVVPVYGVLFKYQLFFSFPVLANELLSEKIVLETNAALMISGFWKRYP